MYKIPFLVYTHWAGIIKYFKNCKHAVCFNYDLMNYYKITKVCGNVSGYNVGIFLNKALTIVIFSVESSDKCACIKTETINVPYCRPRYIAQR